MMKRRAGRSTGSQTSFLAMFPKSLVLAFLLTRASRSLTDLPEMPRSETAIFGLTDNEQPSILWFVCW